MCLCVRVAGMLNRLWCCLHLPVVEAGTPLYGNDDVERNLLYVEKVAYSKGLSPEAVSVMLEFAMSLRMGKTATNPSLQRYNHMYKHNDHHCNIFILAL